jgi:MOSC domain-containing protein YiiM
MVRKTFSPQVMRTVPAGLSPQFRERIEFGFDLVEAVTDGAGESLTGRRGRNAARGAREKPDPQPLLQSAHGLAQRRLGDAQHGAGAGEAAFARHRHERQHIVEIAPRHPVALGLFVSNLLISRNKH